MEHNIRTDLSYMNREEFYLMELAENRVQWRALLLAVLNLCF
jgi:hypothetical protein